jgi:hypothetical protein
VAVAVVIEKVDRARTPAAPAVCQTMAAALDFDPEDCGVGTTAN